MVTPMELDELKLRLVALDTTCVSDADKSLRIMDANIRPRRAGLKLFGRAHTVRCHEDFLTVLKGLDDAVAGEVLVIDTGGGSSAVVGELMAMEAERKHLGGIVLDGACRDSASLATLTIPVYTRAITPRAGTAQKLGETQISVECGGVTISPGDVLYGDDDGIVVATASELAALLPAAELIKNNEKRTIAAVRRGQSLFERFDFHDHHERVRCGQDSKLTFVS